MKDTKDNKSPVIVGGCGGGGTRVIAEILKRAGVYIGQDLNVSNDNLLFSYLFKHPDRFGKKLTQYNSKHKELLELHERLFLGHNPTKLKDFEILWQSRNVQLIHPHKIKWIVRRTINILKSKPTTPPLWGWKEPYTGFFIDAIHAYYPLAKYILVVRNGLDMAYTNNVQQLQYWGDYLNLDSSDMSPMNKFEFWYRYNKHILSRAKELYGELFLLIKLEDLCLKKEEGIKKLFNFIPIENSYVPPSILEVPNLPKSYQRYLEHDTSWIDDEVRSKLEELGYSINI